MRYCKVPRCPNLTETLYCSVHLAERKRQNSELIALRNRVYDATARSRESAAVYNSAEWKRTRDAVLKRDAVCVICGQEPSRLVHHVTELKDGGDALNTNNLSGVCFSCHAKISAENRRRRGEVGKNLHT